MRKILIVLMVGCFLLGVVEENETEKGYKIQVSEKQGKGEEIM
jgi:hypothetical protein